MVIDCLIVKEKWLELILERWKCLEIRGSRTHKRGLIGLIQSGSGEVKGLVNLVGCRKIDKTFFENFPDLHQIKDTAWEDLPYKNVYGWLLEGAVRLKKPIKYVHPRGAVIWVKVDVPTEVEYGETYIGGGTPGK